MEEAAAPSAAAVVPRMGKRVVSQVGFRCAAGQIWNRQLERWNNFPTIFPTLKKRNFKKIMENFALKLIIILLFSDASVEVPVENMMIKHVTLLESSHEGFFLKLFKKERKKVANSSSSSLSSHMKFYHKILKLRIVTNT